MKKIKQFIIVALVFSLATPAVALAVANSPTIPLLVYGEAKIDGANAPIGTVITVFNGAAEVARTTVSQVGKYFLEVPAGNAGANLTYKVNGAVSASAVCPNSLVTPSVRIDLAITTPAPTPAPIPAPTPTPAPASGNGNNSGGGGSPLPNLTPTPTPAPASTSTPTLMPTPSPAPTVTPQVLGVKIASAAEIQLNTILTDSAAIWSENLNTILANAKAARDENSEKITADKYLSNLTHNEKSFLAADANRLNFFITYGTVGTKILGAGERAGVISSYKSAFSKLPKTETQWQDAIKIANGRWPSEKNGAAEAKAKTSFKKIYGREAKMSNTNDNAAVTVMAYGLRPSARNLNSEKAAILSFKYFYKRAPISAADWDAVRAIAYSGAKR